jgi:hypothetical protein
VLGPLSPYVEPHSYDLCGTHADRLTVPRGWAVVRLEAESPRGRAPVDDLASRPSPSSPPTTPGGRHLRAVPSRY